MELTRDPDGTIVVRKQVEDHVITFRAVDVRRERGKPRATVTIGQDDLLLDEDEFPLADRDRRNRFSNSAHKALNGLAEIYPQQQLQHDLLLFCRQVWPFEVEQHKADITFGADQDSEPPFVLKDYVVEGGGTILFAPPGRGKSYAGLLMAQSIAWGNDAIWDVTRCPTLFVNLERDRRSFERRLRRVNLALGMEPTSGALMLHARGQSLVDVFEAVQRTVEEHQVGVVFLDSLSRAGIGDMNENRLANQTMDLLNRLGCAWVALAHTPRADESHVFGSQMYDAAADLVVRLLTEARDRELGIGFQVTKANDTWIPPLKIWAYEFHPDYGLAAVREAQAGEFLEIEGQEPKSLRDLVKDHLLTHGEDYGANIAKELNKDPGDVSRVLKDTHTFTKARKEGVKQYFAVLSDRGAT